MKWLMQRVAVLLFAIVVLASTSKSASARMCDYQDCCYPPYSACNACWQVLGGGCDGEWTCPCSWCCQDALCSVWNEDNQEYEYWYANYMWCYYCCEV
jgi:hypothetical protein